MMRNLSLIILLFCSLAFAACKEEKDSQVGLYAKINVNDKKDKIELILQDIFDVEYVPLETNDESLTFGFVKAISDEFIIAKNANFRDGDLFVFDRKGKLVRKINHKGNANGEYVFTSQVFFDEMKNELYVSCLATSKIYVYDIQGNFKHSFNYRESEHGPVVYNPIYRFDPEHLIGCDHTSGRWIVDGKIDLEQENIFHILSDQDGSVTEEIKLPYDKKVSQVLLDPPHVGIVRNNELFPYKGQWLLADPSTDTIYVYSPQKELRPFIVRTPPIQSMNPEIFLFPGVITDKYYFVQAVKKEFNEEDDSFERLTKMDWVYDVDKRMTFEYKLYNSDFTHKRLIKNLSFDILNLLVMNTEDIAFAERLEASELVDAYKKGQLRGRLKEVAAELEEDSNPVIMLAKRKNK